MSCFRLPAQREMLTAELVQGYLADIKTPLTEFTSICLSDKSYGLEAAEALVPTLAQLSSLTHADVSDIIAGRHEDIAKQVMRTIAAPLAALPGLTSLDWSSNAMGLKGIVAIERLLVERRASLQHLYFNNCGNEADAVEHIHKCLLPTEDSVTNLRTFQMAKNCLIAAGCHQVARIVARSPLLEDLKVSGTRVPSVGTLALVLTLLANGALRLRRLDLSDNSFEAADSYEALAQLLAAPQCAELTHLNLSACMLESAGMRAVCRALRRSRAPLQHVDLSMNDAASFAAPAIARLLVAKRRTLVTVALDDNSLRASGATEVCAALVRLPLLRSATLSNTQLKGSAIPALEALLSASAAASSSSLSRLNLNGNFFTAAEVEHLQAAVGAAALDSFDDNQDDMADEEYDEEDEDDEEGEAEAAEDAEDEAAGAADAAAATAAVVAALAADLGNLSVGAQ